MNRSIAGPLFIRDISNAGAHGCRMSASCMATPRRRIAAFQPSVAGPSGISAITRSVIPSSTAPLLATCR
jgi:hypothetical protein